MSTGCDLGPFSHFRAPRIGPGDRRGGPHPDHPRHRRRRLLRALQGNPLLLR